MHKQKLEAAKKLFFILLGIDMLATAIVLISYIWVISILKDVDRGVIVANASLISTVEFWDNFAKVMFLTLIGVGVGLVKWINACYTYAKEALFTTGFKQDSWTTGGWILPVMNLFKPYQVINEIYKVGGLGYQNAEDWKKESWSGLLLTWWIFYAITHLIGTIATKYLLKQAIRFDATMQQSISSIELSSIFCVFSLIVAGLWFLVAGSLTRRLLKRNPVIHNVQTSTVAKTSAANIPTVIPLQVSAPNSNLKQSPPLSQPVLANFAASAVTTSGGSDDLWAQALTEYDSGNRNQGLWARLFSEAQGNEAVVKANYMRIRVDEMQQEIAAEKDRIYALENAEEDIQQTANLEAKSVTSDNRFITKPVAIAAVDNDFMKWLPWLLGVILVIGLMMYLVRDSIFTNQPINTVVPNINQTQPTAPTAISTQKTDLRAITPKIESQANIAAAVKADMGVAATTTAKVDDLKLVELGYTKDGTKMAGNSLIKTEEGVQFNLFRILAAPKIDETSQQLYDNTLGTIKLNCKDRQYYYSDEGRFSSSDNKLVRKIPFVQDWAYFSNYVSLELVFQNMCQTIGIALVLHPQQAKVNVTSIKANLRDSPSYGGSKVISELVKNTVLMSNGKVGEYYQIELTGGLKGYLSDKSAVLIN